MKRQLARLGIIAVSVAVILAGLVFFALYLLRSDWAGVQYLRELPQVAVVLEMLGTATPTLEPTATPEPYDEFHATAVITEHAYQWADVLRLERVPEFQAVAMLIAIVSELEVDSDTFSDMGKLVGPLVVNERYIIWSFCQETEDGYLIGMSVRCPLVDGEVVLDGCEINDEEALLKPEVAKWPGREVGRVG